MIDDGISFGIIKPLLKCYLWRFLTVWEVHILNLKKSSFYNLEWSHYKIKCVLEKGLKG